MHGQGSQCCECTIFHCEGVTFPPLASMMSFPLQQTKRKLEDVFRKLESLYDKLRDNAVSPLQNRRTFIVTKDLFKCMKIGSSLQLSAAVVSGLHQIVGAIQKYDYHAGLAVHTQMISQGNFSEISSFMPGIKVLIQTASTLQVYVQ